MKIILVRHGRPACDRRTRIRGGDFEAWVRSYDASGLTVGEAAPGRLSTVAAGVGAVVSSPLRRAVESAQLVAPGAVPDSLDLFREAEVPTEFRSRLLLRPTSWTLLARAAWLVGLSGGAESAHEARIRARHAATHLGEVALARGSVMLVGHGYLNSLVGRELRRAGWRRKRLLRRGYWAATAYVRTA